MSYRWQDCYCRECRCMDLNDVSRYDNEDCYCTYYRKYYNKNSNACSSGFQYDESRRNVSGGCYLTTIVNNILHMPDNGLTLKTLRQFRDEYMLNHPELYVMLIEYEVVGPKIANNLLQDPQREIIAKAFYSSHIIPTVTHIINKEYDEAIALYQDMTNRLKEFYKADDTITKKLDINVKTLGKARIAQA